MPSASAPRAAVHLWEDDAALADEIVAAFAEAGIVAQPVASREALLACGGDAGGRVLVMDRLVGDFDSLDLLETLRSRGDRIPVVVISSLASVDERIRGLRAGGDDYLVKPFAMGELIARVEALRRRAADDRRTRLVAGPLEVDLIARSARRGARDIPLLPREFALLEYLMRHVGQTVTRAMLLEDVWHYASPMQTNVVDVHVGNLRKKIDADGEPRLIVSVRGLGFKLVVDEPAT